MSDIDPSPATGPHDEELRDEQTTPWRAQMGADGAHICLLHVGETPPLELHILARILDEGVRRTGPDLLHWRWLPLSEPLSALTGQLWVLAEDPAAAGLSAAACGRLSELGGAGVFVGPAATWLAGSSAARGQRMAVPWEDAAVGEVANDVVASPSIIEFNSRWTTCSGGFAVIDLGLLMLQELVGSNISLQVMDALCLDRVREPSARQRSAAAGRLGTMVPKLGEAIALMETNIEEPLQTDEIARLVGVSRRQLERLFKQHLSTVPSRYYLDIRLQRARKLLRETRHSLLQVGLICGFSSGSHFSSTYSSVFGITPREERQKVMIAISR